MEPALSVIERAWREQEMAAASSVVGETVFQERWAEGQNWSRAQAVACALKIARNQAGLWISVYLPAAFNTTNASTLTKGFYWGSRSNTYLHPSC